MYALIVNSGKHKGKKIELPNHEVLIGRDEASFIRMTSTDVSRHHCTLTPTPKGLLVRDLKSQNGTIVNDVRIESETFLQPGDRLQIGPIHFEVARARPAKPESVLDNDIFGWLSESDTATDFPNASDTTVVKAAQLEPQPATEQKPTGEQKPTAEPRPAPEQRHAAEQKPKFKTIAEEARDIIRRHRESLGET
jgi:pSer/pThr/pTyr-binding forkhead associated (FHA) protein